MVMTRQVAYLLAAVIGAGLWLVTAQVTGTREAWDAGGYWMFAYPLAMVAAGALAYVAPHSGAWRLGLVLMLAQAAAMIASTGSGNLLPLGLVLFIVLAIPPAAVATVLSAIASNRKSASVP